MSPSYNSEMYINGRVISTRVAVTVELAGGRTKYINSTVYNRSSA